MKNAHLRFLPVTLQISKENTTTRISAYCDRLVADEEKTHLLSLVGSDSVMAAFQGALIEALSLDIQLPDEREKRKINLGKNVFMAKASIVMPNRKQPLRHIVALSEEFHASNADRGIFVLTDDDEVAWSLLVCKLGLPGRPDWGHYMMDRLRNENRVQVMTGWNLSPISISATREEMLEWIGQGVREGYLKFPAENGPIQWPQYTIAELVGKPSEEDARAEAA
jgi:hypothetical protein